MADSDCEKEQKDTTTWVSHICKKCGYEDKIEIDIDLKERVEKGEYFGHEYEI